MRAALPLSAPLLVLVACAGAPSVSTPLPTPTLVASSTPTPMAATSTPVPVTRTPPTPLATPTLGVATSIGAVALTVGPVLQATSMAAVPPIQTLVASNVSSEQVQQTVRQIGDLLGGVRFDVEQNPPGASPADTTSLVLRGSDSAGGLARIQPFARQLAAQAGLAVAGQVFPIATVELVVVDAAGTVILHGTRQPGYQPVVTVQE